MKKILIAFMLMIIISSYNVQNVLASDVIFSEENEILDEKNSFSISADFESLSVGDSKNINVIADFDFYYDEVEFSSSDNSVAIIDTNGNVTALKVGTVSISAKLNEYSDTLTFNIYSSDKNTEELNPQNDEDINSDFVINHEENVSETNSDLKPGDINNNEMVVQEKSFADSKSVNIDSNDINVNKTEIRYSTHIEGIGWQDYRSDGELSGTTGQGRRLEGIKIITGNNLYSGNVIYRTHVEGIGWQDYRSDGELSGTTGQGKRLEAIKINLTGDLSKYYDIYYRVHVQSLGWLGWAKNDEVAGSCGYGLRLEGIEIMLLNSEEIFNTGSSPNYRKLIEYQTHVEGIGWQSVKADGELSGTEGQGRRLEAIKIFLNNSEYSGSVEYKSHVEGIGWQSVKTDGKMSGTEGQGRRLEAVNINLTGDLSNHYDIYYRVHVQSLGWLGWAKNGEIAGSYGMGLRLEGIEIKLLNSGEYFDTGFSSYYHKLVEYKSHVEGIGWQSVKADGELSGTEGFGKRLEAFRVVLIDQEYGGDIKYKSYIEGIGWESDYKSNGEMSGTSGQSKRIEAIRMALTDEMSEKYDIYYKVHVQGFGNLGWAKNDEVAGSIGYSYRIEALEIKLVKKGTVLNSDVEAFMENNDGYFVIASGLNTNKVLDAYCELTKDGSDVVINDRIDSLAQIWRITKHKNGLYSIISSMNPNVYLTNNDTKLQLFLNNGSDDQLWDIKELGDGFVSIISNNSGLYLDIIDNKTDNGSLIGICEGTGANNQKYMLISYDKPKIYKGLDVSSHQNVDWNIVQHSVNFAIIRLGFGSDYSDQDDAKFIENVRGCEENNIPYGIYIYSYALNTQDAASEADHALRLVKETGSNFRLGIWFDMEDADGYKARHGFFDGNQAAKEADICNTFLSIISSNNYTSGLYASLNWLNGDLNNPVLDRFEKWVAHWNGPVTFDEAINSSTSYSKPYRYWQFCSDGHINGVTGGQWNNVDLDLGYDIFD